MPTSAKTRDVAPELVWRAQPKQAAFLRAKEFCVLYGGAAGGGKTDALLIDLIRCCVEHPGAKTLLVRKTFADLGKPGAAIDRAHELLHDVAKWDGQEHKWEFGNGSKLQFGHLQFEQSMYAYQGSQLDRLAFDELTQFERRQFLYLIGRVRATVPGVTTAVRAASNPGGIGHGWVKQMFIDAAAWGERFDLADEESGTVVGDARFIPAKLADNPAMVERDPGYGQRLNLLPEDLRRAYRDGDWDVFAGQFFTDWRRDRHVCEPRPIPEEWPRWRSVDFGYGAPFCCLWFARDPETRRVYVYREAYAAGVLDADQAKAIAQLSRGERIRGTWADPSMWNRQANGSTIAGVYAANGVAIAPANNDRTAGWQRVREALSWDRERPPALQVFATCTNLLRTLPLMIHDARDVEDLDTAAEDHAVDSLRYGLMGGMPPSSSKTPVSVGGAQPRNVRHWSEQAPSAFVQGKETNR